MASASATSGRFGDLGQPQQSLDHVLHLRFFRAPITHHRRLDGQGRVFADVEARGGGGQHRHPAHLPQLKRGFRVHGVEHVFDGGQLRPVGRDHPRELGEDALQTAGQRLARREPDGARGHTVQLPVVGLLHHAITGALGAAVDAQHAHAPDGSRRSPATSHR